MPVPKHIFNAISMTELLLQSKFYSLPFPIGTASVSSERS